MWYVVWQVRLGRREEGRLKIGTLGTCWVESGWVEFEVGLSLRGCLAERAAAGRWNVMSWHGRGPRRTSFGCGCLFGRAAATIQP
jgi:hypothetical protein